MPLKKEEKRQQTKKTKVLVTPGKRFCFVRKKGGGGEVTSYT